MIPQDQGGGEGAIFMRISKFLYPPSIARCQHVKVNGVQCGSPALKSRKLCHFHQRWQQGRIQLNANRSRRSRYSLDLPILEDANSIQVALMQGMRLLLTNQVDHRTAALLFYALQTASSNLSRTTFEPRPQQVVIDPSSIADTSLGDDAWYKEEFTQEDDEQEAAPADIHATINIQAMAESGSASVGTGLRPVLTGQRPVPQSEGHSQVKTRTESDSMGKIEVPANVYWGAQTQRSLLHFDIGRDVMPPELIRAFGILKKACALVNQDLGKLSSDIAK